MAGACGSAPFYARIQRMQEEEIPWDPDFIERAAKRFPNDKVLQKLLKEHPKTDKQ